MKNILISIITLICTIQIGCGDMETLEPQPVNWDDVEKVTYLFCTPGDTENVPSNNRRGYNLSFEYVMQYRYATGACLMGSWWTIEGYYSSATPLVPKPIYFSGFRNVTTEYILPEFLEIGESLDREGQIIITLEEWHTIAQCPECPDKSTVEGPIYFDHSGQGSREPSVNGEEEPVDMCSLCTEFVEEHVKTITIVFNIMEAHFDGEVLDITYVKKASFDEKIVE